jgi:hypothetical protein
MDQDSQDPEGGNPLDEGIDLTPLQIFALSYLYYEELMQRQKQQDLDNYRLATHHSHSNVIPRPISIRVRELITIIPSSMIPEMLTIQEVCNQLNILEEYQLLTHEYRREGEHASFSITGEGILYVKQLYAHLSRAIKDKRDYEKKIDRIEGNAKIKEYLKGILSKLKEKSQEEIADMILLGVKTYGPLLIPLVMSVLTNKK